MELQSMLYLTILSSVQFGLASLFACNMLSFQFGALRRSSGERMGSRGRSGWSGFIQNCDPYFFKKLWSIFLQWFQKKKKWLCWSINIYWKCESKEREMSSLLQISLCTFLFTPTISKCPLYFKCLSAHFISISAFHSVTRPR